MLLTVDNGGTAVIDLCGFPELGSFLDISQQGIPSPSTTNRLGLRALSEKKGQKLVILYIPLPIILTYQCTVALWMYAHV